MKSYSEGRTYVNVPTYDNIVATEGNNEGEENHYEVIPEAATEAAAEPTAPSSLPPPVPDFPDHLKINIPPTIVENKLYANVS